MATMPSHRLTTIATVAIGTAVIGLGSVATASLAAASSADDTFITKMKAQGITFTSPENAVQAGQLVCAELATGRNETDVAVEVRNQTLLSAQQAAYFVVEAANVYCPRAADHAM
jgi:Protein of unknown function (DUF732)